MLKVILCSNNTLLHIYCITVVKHEALSSLPENEMSIEIPPSNIAFCKN